LHDSPNQGNFSRCATIQLLMAVSWSDVTHRQTEILCPESMRHRIRI